MKTTKTTDKNGQTIQTNWMLDDVIQAFERRGMNNDSNDELIKELTIQKIEYARTSIYEFMAENGIDLKDITDYSKGTDIKLQNIIIELGGKPHNIIL